jgi:hypothetical protein
MRPHAQAADLPTAGENAGACAALGKPPRNFFLIVFALSLPFWLIGAVIDLQLMPGLSVSALMAFCPLAAASILAH